jgi:enoyl-CoA hydratase/carnithine racemase
MRAGHREEVKSNAVFGLGKWREPRLSVGSGKTGPELMPAALDYARRIAADAPRAVQAAKELALRAREMDRVTGLRTKQLVNRLLQFTADAKEGAAAFCRESGRPPSRANERGAQAPRVWPCRPRRRKARKSRTTPKTKA